MSDRGREVEPIASSKSVEHASKAVKLLGVLIVASPVLPEAGLVIIPAVFWQLYFFNKSATKERRDTEDLLEEAEAFINEK